MTRLDAIRYRSMIETAAQTMPDEMALESVPLFPGWASGRAYNAGDRVRYNGILYRCGQTHTSQPDWSPDITPALWHRVLIEDPGTAPEWVQPDSTNPYSTGDRVTHNGKIWVSTIDENTWEPGIYGWEEIA